MMLTAETATTSQIATFYVGDLLLGIKIDAVQEINRQIDVTAVPHAPEIVRGVINLRGDVVTVVDMRTLLGLPATKVTRQSRCVVIHSKDELIGVLVDRIDEILSVPVSEIDPPPANIDGIEGRFFEGVYTLESEVVVILDVEQMLESD